MTSLSSGGSGGTICGENHRIRETKVLRGRRPGGLEKPEKILWRAWKEGHLRAEGLDQVWAGARPGLRPGEELHPHQGDGGAT